MEPKKQVAMEAIYPCVAGLDVHQATVMACRQRLVGRQQAEVEVGQFGTSKPEGSDLRFCVLQA